MYAYFELSYILNGFMFLYCSRYQLIALHSVLSSENQSLAFRVAPKGTRKVVLATNIAETGITIPDVVFVIDAGKEKQNRYLIFTFCGVLILFYSYFPFYESYC